MKNINNVLIYVFILSIFFLSLQSCKGKAKGDISTVNVRLMGDPGNLNILNASTVHARVIDDLIFMSLTSTNFDGDYNAFPLLIKELPKITEITEGEFKGGMKLEMEIKDEATWDNGSPITGYDYQFTMKTILNPLTQCKSLKPFYEWVGDVLVDSVNPKKITIFSNRKYYKIQDFACGVIIPEYNYDPIHLMKKFSIRDLNTSEKREKLKSNKDMLAFAEDYNSDKYQRDPKHISGMGAYKLESWVSGQEVTLVRKENWWGDRFKDQRAFWAFPHKLKFKVINDQSAAISALKSGLLDEFTAVPAKDFNEMKKSATYLNKFNFVETDMFYLSTLIINNRLEKFKDVNVRKALTLAVDRDKINQMIFDGKYQKAVSFVHPNQKAFNHDLKPYEFNIKESNKLLDKAGWKDLDGDGIRDKVLKGKKTPLIVEFKYNSGNEQRKNTALILKEDYKKIGVLLEITAKESALIQKETENYNFEMCYIANGIPANMSDPKQQWHSSSAIKGGDNKSGFGNIVSDKLIDGIDQELDERKRIQYYIQLQKNIYEECPVIFLFYAKNRIVYSSKFKVKTHMINDCVNFNEFAPAN